MPKTRSWTDAEFENAVAENISIAGVIRQLGLGVTGGNYQAVRRHAQRLKLSTEHWLGQGYLKGRTHNWTKAIPLKNILVQRSVYGGGGQRLKRRLIREGLLEDKCYICGCGPEWRGEFLVLVLDHINGTHNDNRIENLRVLCPNCDSQTATYGGRNKRARGGIGRRARSRA